MNQFGEFSRTFDAFGKQLDVLVVSLFAAGLFIGVTWYVLPMVISEKRLKTTEIAFTVSIALVIMLLGWVAQ